jgi:hypothetical protein
MRIVFLLMTLAGCASQRELVVPYYQSGVYPYGPISEPPPPR